MPGGVGAPPGTASAVGKHGIGLGPATWYQAGRIVGNADMREIRCGKCAKKLGMGLFEVIQIKCPRCGTLNSERAESPKPERQGASSTKGVQHDAEKSLGLGGWQKPTG